MHLKEILHYYMGSRFVITWEPQPEDAPEVKEWRQDEIHGVLDMVNHDYFLVGTQVGPDGQELTGEKYQKDYRIGDSVYRCSKYDYEIDVFEPFVNTATYGKIVNHTRLRLVLIYFDDLTPEQKQEYYSLCNQTSMFVGEEEVTIYKDSGLSFHYLLKHSVDLFGLIAAGDAIHRKDYIPFVPPEDIPLPPPVSMPLKKKQGRQKGWKKPAAETVVPPETEPEFFDADDPQWTGGII